MNVPRDVLKKKVVVKKKKIPVRMFTGDDSIPDKIVIYYKRKIDFDRIDKAIIYKYEILKKTIPELKSKKKKMKQILEGNNVRSVKLHAQKEIDKISEEISDYESEKSLKEYISSTREILQLLKGDQGNNEDLIEEYFTICRRYINIDFIRTIDGGTKCRGCGEKIEESIQPDVHQACPHCDCLNETMRPSKYIRDVEFGNTVYDEDIINFIKVMDKFEGKNMTPIHEGLYDELDAYMENINMKKGEYYRALPLKEDGEKDGTTKQILWQALENLGYNQYYDEASYICHVYWGWKLPDLSLYRDKLIEIYQSTQAVWVRIKKDYKRSASLGTQFRLYVQLLAVGYPYCKKENFRIQEMVQSLRLHNHAWKRMCEEAGVEYHPINS